MWLNRRIANTLYAACYSLVRVASFVWLPLGELAESQCWAADECTLNAFVYTVKFTHNNSSLNPRVFGQKHNLSQTKLSTFHIDHHGLPEMRGQIIDCNHARHLEIWGQKHARKRRSKTERKQTTEPKLESAPSNRIVGRQQLVESVQRLSHLQVQVSPSWLPLLPTMFVQKGNL